jgi:hypothetical protein
MPIFTEGFAGLQEVTSREPRVRATIAKGIERRPNVEGLEKYISAG